MASYKLVDAWQQWLGAGQRVLADGPARCQLKGTAKGSYFCCRFL